MKLLDLKRLEFGLWRKKKAWHFGWQTVGNLEKDVDEQSHHTTEGLVLELPFYIPPDR